MRLTLLVLLALGLLLVSAAVALIVVPPVPAPAFMSQLTLQSIPVAAKATVLAAVGLAAVAYAWVRLRGH
jgi:hypothetical protein